MDKCIFFVFFYFFPFISLWAHAELIGKVVDAKKYPIMGVFICIENRPDIGCQTNEKGIFTLSIDKIDIKDVRLKISCVGYKEDWILYPQLTDTIFVQLENEPITLPEIEISYIKANNLLRQGIRNLKTNLLKDTPLCYQLNYTEQEMLSGENRMLNAKYVSMVKKMPKEKGKIPYQLSLISKQQIDKIQQPPNSKLFTKNVHSVEFQIQQIDYYEINEFYSVKYLDSEADSVFYLVCNPNLKKKKIAIAKMIFGISKSDTILISMQVESIDSIINIIPYDKKRSVMYKPQNIHNSITFRKDENDGYYMYQLESKSTREFIFGDKKEILSYHLLTQFEGYYLDNLKDKIKINGYTKGLFKLKDTQ
jgi:hypothetical protein